MHLFRRLFDGNQDAQLRGDPSVTATPTESGESVIYPDREPASQVGHAFIDRFELLITLLLDTAFIAAAILSRGVLLRLFEWMLPPGTSGALLPYALEWVVNVILVLAAILITAFDMAKRVRNAYDDLRSRR
jgi:hypothetical protein